ncbi:MAG: helix-turn-helix domain-containing protein [Lachnospiraceae bacterium]|nr:helix-turn-helix domain-containing protein [Lachnospiraceae bacterium]
MMDRSRAVDYQNYNYVSPDVIAAAVKGDGIALRTIKERYDNYALKLARSLTRKDRRKGRKTPLEDVLQVAWMGVFEDIRKFRGK